MRFGIGMNTGHTLEEVGPAVLGESWRDAKRRAIHSLCRTILEHWRLGMARARYRANCRCAAPALAKGPFGTAAAASITKERRAWARERRVRGVRCEMHGAVPSLISGALIKVHT
jgi:hypothetical protein